MKNIDFLPQAYHELRIRRHQRMRRLGLAVAGVFLLAVWFAVDELRLYRTRGQLEYLVRQNEVVQSGLEHMAYLQAEQTQLLERYRLIRELESPVSCVTTLQRIAELLPKNVIVRHFQLTNGTPAATGPEVPTPVKPQTDAPEPIRVVLAGLAPSQVEIAVFVGHLSSCREFSNVRLEYSRAAELESRQVHEFRVTFDLPTGDVESSVPQRQASAASGEFGV